MLFPLNLILFLFLLLVYNLVYHIIIVRGGYDDYDIWFDTQTLLLYNSTQSETYYIHENFPCTIESMSNPYPDIIHFDEKQRSFYYYYTNETIEEKSFQIVTDFKRNLTFQVKPAGNQYYYSLYSRIIS